MGDSTGYDDFVGARWAPLVRSAMLLGCDRTEAEDLAQTALIRCYVSWRRIREADDADAYLYRILVNAFRTSRRRRWWGERAAGLDIGSAGTHQDPAAAVTVTHTVRGALARLPADQRVVVVLRYFSDLSEAQTATALGIPAGTVKSRSSRALATLAQDEDIRQARI